MRSILAFGVVILLCYGVFKFFFGLLRKPPVSDSDAELESVMNKVGVAMIFKRYGYALYILNRNIGRFEGRHKATLLNLRGGVYLIKGNKVNYLSDHKEAYELDNNLTNLSNYAEALIHCNMEEQAKQLARLGLENPTLSVYEREVFMRLLAPNLSDSPQSSDNGPYIPPPAKISAGK